MKAVSINLQKIFEQTIHYRIPLFQRPYVWSEEENWLPIWEDINILADMKYWVGGTGDDSEEPLCCWG